MSGGIFVTQVGVSVPTAADYQFVFNSNWPSLQCAFDTTVTVGALAKLIIPHNLGFYPLVMGWLIQNGVSLGRIFAPSENFQGSQALIDLSFDKVNLYLTNSDTGTYQVNLKAYNLDIAKPVNYTLPVYPALNQPYDSSTGIKVTKTGKQITSTDLRDFTLHSRAQAPAVLAIVTEALPRVAGAGPGTIAYVNPVAKASFGQQQVPYIPWTLAFYNTSGVYRGLAPGAQQSGAIFRLVSNIQGSFGITAMGNGAILNLSTLLVAFPKATGSLVVLRDPLLAPSAATQVFYNG